MSEYTCHSLHSPQSMVVRFSSWPVACLASLSIPVIITSMAYLSANHKPSRQLIFLVWLELRGRILQQDKSVYTEMDLYTVGAVTLNILVDLSLTSLHKVVTRRVWLSVSQASVLMGVTLSHPCALLVRDTQGVNHHLKLMKNIGFAEWTHCDPSWKCVINMSYNSVNCIITGCDDLLSGWLIAVVLMHTVFLVNNS